MEKCRNRLGLKACNRGKIAFLHREKLSSGRKTFIDDGEPAAGGVLNADGRWEPGSGLRTGDYFFTVRPEDIIQPEIVSERSPMAGTGEEKCGDSDFSGFSDAELAALCVGYGPGTPFSAAGNGADPPTICDGGGKPLTVNSHPAGFPGYVSPAMPDRGIFSVFYKDGPAGIGETVWPSEMLLACSFDRELWWSFGDAVGAECEKQQVDIWLAPAVNLHRNPLCGRNFEYFSEDPFLTGSCACEIAKGVQEKHPVLVCPKHSR